MKASLALPSRLFFCNTQASLLHQIYFVPVGAIFPGGSIVFFNGCLLYLLFQMAGAPYQLARVIAFWSAAFWNLGLRHPGKF